jgi:hypothetical protein
MVEAAEMGMEGVMMEELRMEEVRTWVMMVTLGILMTWALLRLWMSLIPAEILVFL